MVPNVMPVERTFSAHVGDKEIIIKTGKLAELAGGAVIAQMGETVLFCSATMSAHPREGIDFLPLSVDYEERLYAAGRIPGSFMRREGRPSERSILIARVTDRPLRPLFPKDMRNEIQIINMSLVHDQENDNDMLSIIAASTALTISDIPFKGPIGAARVGLIDGELRVNPTISEMENSTLDLRVAGTEEAILMVECSADEVPEDTMLEALFLAHDSMQDIIRLQNQMREEIGKEKREYEAVKNDVEDPEALKERVTGMINQDIATIVATRTERDDRNDALEDLRERVVTNFFEDDDGIVIDDTDLVDRTSRAIRETIMDSLRTEIRRRIVEEGIRPDGRDTKTIRDLGAEVAILPRVHGSSIFKRGQTQVMGICTLGTPGDSQSLDGLHPEENKRFLHHYNFPPYSTGETWMMRGPKRREIGHGALAENALRVVLPDEEEFPYTLRVVSEVMASNGSTSMASVCAGTLALMDAGVPIKAPVAGIAMGLIKEDDQYVVLTDIQGMEDHLGDMDFKVAGTETGITALQMDMKISGIPNDKLTEALNQAKDARMAILELITSVMPAPRDELSDYAPRIETVKIDVEQIGAIIGPGGKTVRGIQEETGVSIDIEENGLVFISSADKQGLERAREMILALVEEAEIGQIYTGKITRLENYGAFVEFLPGTDGLVHISQLSDGRVENIHQEFKVGDEIMVMVVDIDPSSGKIRLSRQAVLEGWTAEEARERDSRGGRSGGGNRGGGNRSGGNRGGGNRGGGNRGGGRR